MLHSGGYTCVPPHRLRRQAARGGQPDPDCYLIRCKYQVTIVLGKLCIDAVVQQGLNTPYMPRADGTFISTPPQQLALQGNLASVPFIIGGLRPCTSRCLQPLNSTSGDVKDEGTLFSLGSMNITYVMPLLQSLHF